MLLAELLESKLREELVKYKNREYHFVPFNPVKLFIRYRSVRMKHFFFFFSIIQGKHQTGQAVVRHILAFPFSITKTNSEKSVSRKSFLKFS